jgi:alanine-synthesizing transaminase
MQQFKPGLTRSSTKGHLRIISTHGGTAVIVPARRIENVKYAIRNVVAEAKKLEALGQKILYLNIGDPLKFDFVTPPHMIEAVHRAMRDGHNGYAPSVGVLEARAAVAREAERSGLPGVTPDDVLITTGASEAIDLTLTALLEPGESVLLPSPGYPLYNAVAAKIGVQVVPYQLDEARGWSLDVSEIDGLVTKSTRAIVIGNPNNPTGAVQDRATLEALLDLARRHKLVVLSDEIYDKLTFDAKHIPTASLARDVPIVTFNGLSKNYLACGWRIGWVIFNNAHLLKDYKAGVLRLADARLSSPLPNQMAIAPALEGPQDHIPEMMKRLRVRRDLTTSRINAIRGLSLVEPHGAFYAMPRLELAGVTSDEAFVMDLLRETGVLFVHGSGFGQKPGTMHFRIVYLPPKETLERAYGLLKEFVETRY